MVFLVICASIFFLILLFSYYTYRTAFYSARDKHIQPDAPMEGKQYEAVSDHLSRISRVMMQYTFEPIVITSFDGTRLHGRYYHFQDGAPLVILMHGYRSHACRDCSGGHALTRKLGFNALVIDQRAHGSSEGSTITFGIKERRDCLCWIKYACARFGKNIPVVLSGLSMGAATVLMTTGMELPENMAAVMADCPYSSPAAIIEKVCGDMHYPVPLCRPFIALGAKLFGGFNIHECTAKEAVRHARVPILLLHGEADHFVPCDMSREIYECCASRAELHTFPDAGHGLCYITDPRRYERVVFKFLSSIPSLSPFISKDFANQFNK